MAILGACVYEITIELLGIYRLREDYFLELTSAQIFATLLAIRIIISRIIGT